MADTKFSAASAVTVLANAIEWGCNNAGASEKLNLEQSALWANGYWIRQAAARTLANSAAEQNLT